jgi:hypothetical protein
VAGVTYGVYRLASASVGAVDGTLSELSMPTAPGLQSFATELVDDWIVLALRSGDAAALQNGLNCLAAVGGPAPERAVEALATRVGLTTSGADVERVLGDLRQRLSSQVGVEPRAGSCLLVFAG